MKYYCLSCRTEIPEGDQLCKECQEKLDTLLIGQFGIKHYKEPRTMIRFLISQSVKQDIKRAKRELRRKYGHVKHEQKETEV